MVVVVVIMGVDNGDDDVGGGHSDIDNGDDDVGGGHSDNDNGDDDVGGGHSCLLYTSPSPRDLSTSRMPSSA